ncbi:acyl-CoA binding protein 3B [Tripterygium wilfordii]|uniref:Acyl-CoA binding protein 3B n=1 Tax=Tripterygium wilfordii TaxID=458696 RepID=A0A7J7D3I1_TRIWF|nr:acyl-CoA binding protein 3B [Tripterygium wilfordii]
MEAAKFVETQDKDGRLEHLGRDVEMEMYGLHEIATAGTCREPQPMALKVSARAKWLGNISPEMAMEQYIEHLSEQVPGWMEENQAVSSLQLLRHGASLVTLKFLLWKLYDLLSDVISLSVKVNLNHQKQE